MADDLIISCEFFDLFVFDVHLADSIQEEEIFENGDPDGDEVPTDDVVLKFIYAIFGIATLTIENLDYHKIERTN